MLNGFEITVLKNGEIKSQNKIYDFTDINLQKRLDSILASPYCKELQTKGFNIVVRKVELHNNIIKYV